MLNWEYHKENKEKGYNFPFILIYPTDIDKRNKFKIFIESFNTAEYNTNNIIPFNEQIKDAEEFASWICKNEENDYHKLYEKINNPVIIPIIERCDCDYKEEFYTQMLGRNVITTQNPKFKRLDLQVIAMIEDLKKELKEYGLQSENKSGIFGFSSSGVFAYRMAFLQPEHFDWVLSLCSNGLMPLPKETFNNKTLIYPLGNADYEQITGKPFNEQAYCEIKQFISVGKEEDNKKYNIVRAGILNSPSTSTLWKDTYGANTTLQDRFEIIAKELNNYSPNIHAELGEHAHEFKGKEKIISKALNELDYNQKNDLSI